MRRLITAASVGALVAGGLVLSLGSAAMANSTCPAGATGLPGGLAIAGLPSGPPSGSGGITVCTTGPATGTVTASGSQGPPPQGYLVADGVPGNQGALAGYIGVDSQNGVTVVGCASGDYNPSAGDAYNAGPSSTSNNAILEATNPAGAVSVPPSTSGPCSPSAPAGVP